MIHLRYIYPHLAYFYAKRRSIYQSHGLFSRLETESFGLAVITASSKQPADSTLRQLPILRLIFLKLKPQRLGRFTYKDQNFIRCLQVYFKFSNSFAGHWSMCMRMGLHHELWWKTRCFSFCIHGSLYNMTPTQNNALLSGKSLTIFHTFAVFQFDSTPKIWGYLMTPA